MFEFTAAEQFMATLGALQPIARGLTVNLCACTRVDLDGVNALLQAQTACDVEGRTPLRLLGVTDTVRRDLQRHAPHRSFDFS